MAGSLAISQLHVVGLAPAGENDVGRARAAVARLDARRVGPAIARALSGIGEDDRRVVILRKLEISIDGARADDPDCIARQIGEGVAAAVAHVAAGAQSDAIIAFASPAARLALFITAIVQHRSWDRWWFADLDTLRMLPISSALRVVLTKQPDEGREALGALSASDRAQVAGALSEIDAELLAEALAATVPPDADETPLWLAAFALPPTPAHLAVAQAVIHDLAALLAEFPQAGRGTIAALRLRAQMAKATGDALSAMVSRDALRLLAVTRGARIRDIARLFALPDAVLARIKDDAAAPTLATAAEPAYTRFGGLFLLWPHLPEVAWERGAANRDPQATVALLALAALAGNKDSAAAIEDPVLRAALGVDPRTTREDLAAWLQQLVPARLPHMRLPRGCDVALPIALRTPPLAYRAIRGFAMRALTDFAQRLPGFGNASVPFLRNNMFGVGARVRLDKDLVHIVIDRPPLDVLLGISGLADREVILSDQRTLLIERAR